MSKAAVLLFDESRGWVLRENRFGELERFVTAVAKSGHELRAYDDALDFVAGQRDAETADSGVGRNFSAWRE